MTIVYNYSDETDSLYYYKQNNDHVIRTLYNMIDLPFDMCKIIGEYYNCIKVDIKVVNLKPFLYIQLDINNEYMDFKNVRYKGLIMVQYSTKHWEISNTYINNPTILTDNNYGIFRSGVVLNEYMKRIYKINDYFLGKYIDCENKLNITDKVIELLYTNDTLKYEILDTILFRYLIEIIKDIINVYLPHKQFNFL